MGSSDAPNEGRDPKVGINSNIEHCGKVCHESSLPRHNQGCKERACALKVCDQDLFVDPPRRDECPICLQQLPLDRTKWKLQPCCGRMLCLRCSFEVIKGQPAKCPFCRAPHTSSKAKVSEWIKRRVEVNDPNIIDFLGNCFSLGVHGFPQNSKRAAELWLRVGELGCAASYCNLGTAYARGHSVKKNALRARHYYELASMGGSVVARRNLGLAELQAGRASRAMKHFVISARAGCVYSMKRARQGFLDGHVTRIAYERTLSSHIETAGEMRSDRRGAAKLWCRNP
ncbi:hypothetical protein ACHAWF_005564 [Thalassiosira exigua]